MLFLIPLAFVVLGIGLVIAGVRGRRTDTHFLADAREATGTVTGLNWKRFGDQHGPSAFPVIRFGLPDGRTFEAQSQWGSRPAPACEGDTVTVLYDPADPTRMRIGNTVGSGRFLTAVLVIMGVGFTLLGGFLTIVFYLLRDAF